MNYSASKAIGPALALVLCTTATPLAFGQSDTWTDPESKLVWAAKDNGEDISWKAAGKYCHRLKLGGFSDWRMPNMDEAESLFDKRAESPGTMGAKRYHNVDAATWHVKGNIFLTGEIWTALEDPNERCLWTCYAPHFDFNEGKADKDPVGWPYPHLGMRVLCVRGQKTTTQSSSHGAS